MASFKEPHPAELKAQVVKLWNKGDSALVVAGKVGLTRNAIIGIVHRMKAKGVEVRSEKPSVVAKARKARVRKRIDAQVTPRQRQQQITLYTPKAADKHVAPIAPVQISTGDRWVPLTITGSQTCRYTEDGKLFCNATGFPWCEEHRKRVYAPFKPRG
jgi:hypothetical protein